MTNITRSQKSSHLSTQNRTGIDVYPIQNEKLIEIAEMIPPDVLGDMSAFTEMRREFSYHAAPIGSVALPMNQIQDEMMIIFLDKLGERIVLQRIIIRLYEALLAKLPILAEMNLALEPTIQEFHEEKMEQLELTLNIVDSLGADKTSETPSADISGVLVSGIITIVTDPRTTIYQTLYAMLIIEWMSMVGWEFVISLAKKLFFNELNTFEHALSQDQRHIQFIKTYLLQEIDTAKKEPSYD